MSFSILGKPLGENQYGSTIALPLNVDQLIWSWYILINYNSGENQASQLPLYLNQLTKSTMKNMMATLMKTK